MEDGIGFQHAAVSRAMQESIAQEERELEMLQQLKRQTSASGGIAHIGCDVFVPSERDRSQMMLVNVGCDIYVEMNDEQVKEYAERRILELREELATERQQFAEIMELQRMLAEEG